MLVGAGSPISGGNVTVELFALSGTGSAGGLPSGTALATKTVTGLNLPDYWLGGLSATDATTINLSSASGWSLSPSQSYGLVFTTTSPGGLYVAPTTTGTISGGSSGLTFLGRAGKFSVNPPYQTTSDKSWLQVVSLSGGGSSSVPDAGPGPALALLLGGLGLQQWRRTRRTGAAA